MEPKISMGFPDNSVGKEPTCQYRRHKRLGFDPWGGKIPWRRTQKTTPVSLPGESVDRGSWQPAVHGGRKESDTAEATLAHPATNMNALRHIQ